jgi:hypothetical protein
MRSTVRADSTTINMDASANRNASDFDGNSEQFILRKVRAQWKDLSTAFKREAGRRGAPSNLTPDQLRDILRHHDILLSDSVYTTLVGKLDEDGDGAISYAEFLRFFARGQDQDRAVTTGLGRIVAVYNRSSMCTRFANILGASISEPAMRPNLGHHEAEARTAERGEAPDRGEGPQPGRRRAGRAAARLPVLRPRPQRTGQLHSEPVPPKVIRNDMYGLAD